MEFSKKQYEKKYDKKTLKPPNTRIWFQQPAENFITGTPENPSKVNVDGHLGPVSDWISAFPIGNGRLGGQIFGGIEEELIKLNEESFWSGIPKDVANPGWKESLPKVRRLIFEGKYDAANHEAMKMQGPFNESYLPLGNLHLKFPKSEDASAYVRELDLRNAIADVRYCIGDCQYSREYFCSYPDEVMAVRIIGSRKGSVTFSAAMDSMIRYQMLPLEENMLILKGRAPSHVEPNYKGEIDNAVVYEPGKGMLYEARLMVTAQGGRIWTDEQGIHVQDADCAVLLLSAGTSFHGWNQNPSSEDYDPAKRCIKILENASQKGYEELKKRHCDDIRQLFDRVKIELGNSENEILPTDRRVEKLRNGETDPGLYALFFSLAVTC